MLENKSDLTIGLYIYFHKHQHTNLDAYLKGIQQSSLITEMMIQKNVKRLARIEVLITSHMKVYLGNKYNSYIHTVPNAKVASTRKIYEKTIRGHP